MKDDVVDLMELTVSSFDDELVTCKNGILRICSLLALEVFMLSAPIFSNGKSLCGAFYAGFQI